MSGTYTYPFLSVNHHALMLLMLKRNLKFLTQVTELFGIPVRPLPPVLDPDPDQPKAFIHTAKGKSSPLSFDKLLIGDIKC